MICAGVWPVGRREGIIFPRWCKGGGETRANPSQPKSPNPCWLEIISSGDAFVPFLGRSTQIGLMFFFPFTCQLATANANDDAASGASEKEMEPSVGVSTCGL